MRTTILSFLIFLLPTLSIFAQNTIDQRATSTKIADLLARLPAQNESQLNKTMEAVNDLDEAGLVEMIGMMSAPGSGDNTSLEYAIAGYSFYVTQAGKEQERAKAVRAYCSAVDKLSYPGNKRFIIRQLQTVGKDDAVSCLSRFLDQAQFSDPAARALAQVNTPAAEKALLNALQTVKDSGRLALIETLGYSRYKPAVPLITTIATSGKENERKVALHSLARIADPSSAGFLSDAAQKIGYSVENTAATSAYILFLQRLLEDGNEKMSARLIGKLMQQTRGKPLHIRIAALKLLVDANGQKSLPILYRAMQDTSYMYRAAALQFAEGYRSSITNKRWLNTIGSVNPDTKAQLIYFLANSGDRNLLPTLMNLLQDDNSEVRIAAIQAVGRIGQQDALTQLLEMMKKGNPAEIEAIKNAILQMKGEQVTMMVANSLKDMSPAGKVAVLEILATRAYDNAGTETLSYISNPDTIIRNAAVKALPSVVNQTHLPQLFTLLNTSGPADIVYVKQAIISASEGITDTMSRTILVVEQMRNSDAGKQHLYHDILASIGSRESINELQSAFDRGNEQTKKAAVTALSKTSGQKTANILLRIARENPNADYTQAAVNGYINLIRSSSFPADQKVLMLREAMDIAQNTGQRRMILREAGRIPTFLSLVFAGEHFSNKDLEQEAAMAVMNIALSNNELSGDYVRTLLTKTVDLIRGRDDNYQKEAVRKYLEDMPVEKGFVSLFNGTNLDGWKGLVENPLKRANMDLPTLSKEQKKADSMMVKGWTAKDGLLIFTGHGDNLSTEKKYGDFEMLVDWKITRDGDAGIYLRGTPQVQIWDTSRVQAGAQVGSGGLYNNQKHPAKPIKVADNAIGEWNTFHIIMKGDKVTVHLNGELVTDNVVMENYWDRNMPIFPKEHIELQAHGTYVAYRNIFIKELGVEEPYTLNAQEANEGFTVLFDGTNLQHWTGNTQSYIVDNGNLVVQPGEGSGGNLFTKNQYSDFVLRFEFQLTPGANNGLGIRTPLTGDAAYEGMELQILDNEADIYKNLKPYQYHGSVYGIIPAKRGYLKTLGEWNQQEVIVNGPSIKVILNNEVIVDGDIEEATKNGTPDKREHPGLKRKSGHIGFLGHGSVVRFRNIRIKEVKGER